MEHEQSRTDRDDYVIMHWNNIQGGTGNRNMFKINTRDRNPYDLESVLQYRLNVSTTCSVIFKNELLHVMNISVIHSDLGCGL